MIVDIYCDQLKIHKKTTKKQILKRAISFWNHPIGRQNSPIAIPYMREEQENITNYIKKVSPIKRLDYYKEIGQAKICNMKMMIVTKWGCLKILYNASKLNPYQLELAFQR